MSASLVGSEMCIRDRGGDVVALLVRPASASFEIFVDGEGVALVDSRPCPCLLYTSDAADDM
eukprot:5336138-Alexandrium_andersonii.AAC.1